MCTSRRNTETPAIDDSPARSEPRGGRPASARSTAGYTATVNRGQHGRVASFTLAAALWLGAVPAWARPPVSPPPAAPPLPGDLLPPPVETTEATTARGVVTIHRAGQPIALGSVLADDGRIVTALSPLGSGNDLEVRYADDSVVKVRLGHFDRGWDLALLVPQTGRWRDGLAASSTDPLRPGARIRTYGGQQRGRPALALVDVRGRRTLLGSDDQPLDGALELGSRIAARDLGAPLVDERGQVVGVVGRGCLPIEGKPCVPVAYGAPLPAVKAFLRSAPADAVQPMAWLGIQGAADNGAVARGVRILSIAPESPAAEARLTAGPEGDTILAVGGVPVTTPEALVTAIRALPIGERVPLTLFGRGRYRQAEVVLRPPPAPRPPPPAAASTPAPASTPGTPRVRLVPDPFATPL